MLLAVIIFSKYKLLFLSREGVYKNPNPNQISIAVAKSLSLFLSTVSYHPTPYVKIIQVGLYQRMAILAVYLSFVEGKRP